MILKYVEKNGIHILHSIEDICCRNASRHVFSKQVLEIYNFSKNKGVKIPSSSKSSFIAANCFFCAQPIITEIIPNWPNDEFYVYFTQKETHKFCNSISFCCTDMSSFVFDDSKLNVSSKPNLRVDGSLIITEFILMCLGIKLPIEFCPLCGKHVITGIHIDPNTEEPETIKEEV